MEVFANKQKRMDLYHYILRKHVSKEVNNTCIIRVKSLRENAKGFVIYCQCLHSACKLFKISIKNNGLVSVFSTSKNFNHRVKVTGQVRHIERKIVRKQLVHTNPILHKIQTVRESSTALMKVGNLQTIKSDDVNRRIRSEALSSLDREDDVVDMIKMRRSNSHYIQFVGDPFQAHLFSKLQMLVELHLLFFK